MKFKLMDTGELIYHEVYFNTNMGMKSFNSQAVPHSCFSEQEKEKLKLLSIAIKSVIENFDQLKDMNAHVSLVFMREK